MPHPDDLSPQDEPSFPVRTRLDPLVRLGGLAVVAIACGWAFGPCFGVIAFFMALGVIETIGL